LTPELQILYIYNKMNWEELAKELAQVTPAKIILMVLDGLGGLPVHGQTELEAANHPNLDRLAQESACGLTHPVYPGITPGSGPAHLALFGYDPLRYELGRGILEALGSGVEVGPQDLVARGNFATLKGGLITDRRAGRIATSECERLCAKINAGLRQRPGTQIALFPGKEHRFVFKASGPNLADGLTDADPQKEGQPPVAAQPLADADKTAAEVVNGFIADVTALLKDEPAANTVLMRGFSKHPTIPTMAQLYRIKPAAIANYPMYKGLARLAGMDVQKVGAETEDLFGVLEDCYKDFDFFYVHFKRTDSAGEDGNFEAKVRAIEDFDAFVPRLMALKPEVLVVTSDHSTPSLLKAHSWHPNPFILRAASAMPDDVARFTERECGGHGSLGRFPSLQAMSLMLAHAGKLKKFGA
jgi:2,3-bisphosphoglycerate-independent phosphoglycerate mutase